MRTCIATILLLFPAFLFAQATPGDGQAKKIMTDVLEDSSFNSDIAKINGLPLRSALLFESVAQGTVELDQDAVRKQFLFSDNRTIEIILRSFRHKAKKTSETALLSFLLPDGTDVTVSAVRFSLNQRWRPTNYRLSGRNRETNSRVRIYRGEL